jgi:hypothetical protein
MATRKKKSRRRAPKTGASALPETQASESITVAWTVTITTALLCNLAILVAHLYVASHPEAQKMVLLKELLLFAGTVVGMISLLLLPIVHRVRRVPPPIGLVVFGACVAAAPMLALLVRVLG